MELVSKFDTFVRSVTNKVPSHSTYSYMELTDSSTQEFESRNNMILINLLTAFKILSMLFNICIILYDIAYIIQKTEVKNNLIQK